MHERSTRFLAFVSTHGGCLQAIPGLPLAVSGCHFIPGINGASQAVVLYRNGTAAVFQVDSAIKQASVAASRTLRVADLPIRACSYAQEVDLTNLTRVEMRVLDYSPVEGSGTTQHVIFTPEMTSLLGIPCRASWWAPTSRTIADEPLSQSVSPHCATSPSASPLASSRRRREGTRTRFASRASAAEKRAGSHRCPSQQQGR